MSNGKQLRKLFGAQMKMMFREKQVWFWSLFFPIILMVLFMVIFGGGGSGGEFKASIAVVKSNANATSDMLENQLRQVTVFEWKSEQPVDKEKADTWIKDEDVDAVIILPASEDIKLLELVVNKENEQSTTTQAIRGILDQFVQQTNYAVAGVEPTFKVEMQSVSNGSEDLSYVDFLLTGMIALSVAQGGLFGMVDMVEMRRKGLLKRLKMTPVKMGLFGIGGMMVRFVLGVIQIVFLTVIGVFGFGANLHLDVSTLVVAFFIGTLAFNALGYLFSSFSKSIEAYMGMANIASFLMMFLSGIFFPTEGFPDWLQPVSHVLPLTYFVNGMRDGMVYGSGIATGEFWEGIAILGAWGIVAFGIGLLIYRKGKAEVR
ncbi:ABC transporter permease [Cohnella lupini]|uniref:ABC-2 type transport system permease protein n=1 Tax=Cohnella lupini TaxID=1294267 RepID=A0A3D9IVH3_9BACL|nr:ABC transporter permease [Cohnella lupini]RED65828.1 ABC-2 type transport system permease protein [Cohnella lupini]